MVLSITELKDLISSKNQQMSTSSPVNAQLLQQALNVVAEEYTYSSCTIDGNPLSQRETELVLRRLLSIVKEPHKEEKERLINSITSPIEPIVEIVDVRDIPVDLRDPEMQMLSYKVYSDDDFTEVKNHHVYVIFTYNIYCA